MELLGADDTREGDIAQRGLRRSRRAENQYVLPHGHGGLQEVNDPVTSDETFLQPVEVAVKLPSRPLDVL